MYRKIPIEELEKFYIINSNGSIVEKSTEKTLQNILRKKTWKDLTKDIEIIYE